MEDTRITLSRSQYIRAQKYLRMWYISLSFLSFLSNLAYQRSFTDDYQSITLFGHACKRKKNMYKRKNDTERKDTEDSWSGRERRGKQKETEINEKQRRSLAGGKPKEGRHELV